MLVREKAKLALDGRAIHDVPSEGKLDNSRYREDKYKTNKSSNDTKIKEHPHHNRGDDEKSRPEKGLTSIHTILRTEVMIIHEGLCELILVPNDILYHLRRTIRRDACHSVSWLLHCDLVFEVFDIFYHLLSVGHIGEYDRIVRPLRRYDDIVKSEYTREKTLSVLDVCHSLHREKGVVLGEKSLSIEDTIGVDIILATTQIEKNNRDIDENTKSKNNPKESTQNSTKCLQSARSTLDDI